MNLNVWAALEMWLLAYDLVLMNETQTLTFSSECSEFMYAVTCLHQFHFPLMKSHKSSHFLSHSINNTFNKHNVFVVAVWLIALNQFARDTIHRIFSFTCIARTVSLSACTTCLVYVKWNLRNERKLMDSPSEQKRVHK